MADISLPKERILFFTSQVNQESIKTLAEKIILINENDETLKKEYSIHDIIYIPKPIEIYIDSYGGSVYQCLGLISVIEKSKTPVHTIVTGAAMSAGFTILISGHKRFAYKYSTMMYHQVRSLAIGELKTMEDDVKECKRLQKMLEKITLNKTKIKPEKIKEIFKEKIDWFIDAEEALKLNVVDEII